MALILSLLFIVLLAALVIEYAYETEVEAAFVQNDEVDLQAYLAAKSAMTTGLWLLAADWDTKWNDKQTYVCLADAWALEELRVPTTLNEADALTRIQDEYGKLNLNALVDDTGMLRESEQDGETELLYAAFDRLFAARGANEDFMMAFGDWLGGDPLDMNDDEDAATEGIGGKFKSVEQLLLFPEMTMKMFFGDPDATETDQLPLTDLITVHGHPEGKVNLNTAPYEVLLAVEEAMEEVTGTGDGLADGVLAIQEEPSMIANEEELQNPNLGLLSKGEDANGRDVYEPQENLYYWSSQVFRIEGYGEVDLGEGRSKMVRVEAFICRPPLDEDSGGNTGEAEAFRFLDWRVTR